MRENGSDLIFLFPLTLLLHRLRNLGLSLEQGENNAPAMEHLEAFHDLCKDKPWSDRDGIPYVKSACKHLCRIYSTIGTEVIYKQKEDDEGKDDEESKDDDEGTAAGFFLQKWMRYW